MKIIIITIIIVITVITKTPSHYYLHENIQKLKNNKSIQNNN